MLKRAPQTRSGTTRKARNDADRPQSHAATTILVQTFPSQRKTEPATPLAGSAVQQQPAASPRASPIALHLRPSGFGRPHRRVGLTFGHGAVAERIFAHAWTHRCPDAALCKSRLSTWPRRCGFVARPQRDWLREPIRSAAPLSSVHSSDYARNVKARDSEAPMRIGSRNRPRHYGGADGKAAANGYFELSSVSSAKRMDA